MYGANDAEVVTVQTRLRVRGSSAFVGLARRALIRLLPALPTALLPAQAATIPALPPSSRIAGMFARPAFVELDRPVLVRAALTDGHGMLLAVGGRLLRHDGHAPVPGSLQVDLAHDIAFLARAASGNVLAGTLTGEVLELDRKTMRPIAEWPGLANTFDVVPLPNGDLLATANPQWPATNAGTGVYHLSPHQPPRRILRLVGPSGPLTLLPNGDLVVAELGPVVPPPAGAAKLLRIPAARVTAALAGAVLGRPDIAEVGAGYDGLYDLVADGTGRLLSTNPATGRITASHRDGLAADGTWIDLGTGRFATHLQMTGNATATLHPYQPAGRAAQLLISTSNYASFYEIVRVGPRRPQLRASPVDHAPPGPVTLSLRNAPPNGLLLWLASATPSVDDFAALTLDDTPIWLGLAPTDVVVAGAGAVDAAGLASMTFTNPGLDARIDWQAFAWSLEGVGTSNPTFTFLQP